ncbi:hypothetical protein [Paenibacillus sp. Soil724D2]|uniref:hypothetical protein n=1 Tax=Paenibacillus sp. (strain Soil724D2) TaxID=1736392 RepID=UPI000B0118C2|nr:hypothetical protein [Paenibacillus sp. Soil724D2]
MGEVLSFEKHWFLLIPQAGAECPFDNGDQTYWNKTMILFVPECEKLRFTPGPLHITGRLDVGIKSINPATKRCSAYMIPKGKK